MSTAFPAARSGGPGLSGWPLFAQDCIHQLLQVARIRQALSLLPRLCHQRQLVEADEKELLGELQDLARLLDQPALGELRDLPFFVATERRGLDLQPFRDRGLVEIAIGAPRRYATPEVICGSSPYRHFRDNLS